MRMLQTKAGPDGSNKGDRRADRQQCAHEIRCRAYNAQTVRAGRRQCALAGDSARWQEAARAYGQDRTGSAHWQEAARTRTGKADCAHRHRHGPLVLLRDSRLCGRCGAVQWLSGARDPREWITGGARLWGRLSQVVSWTCARVGRHVDPYLSRADHGACACARWRAQQSDLLPMTEKHGRVGQTELVA
ncbi:hypothetical protein L484_011976 [Morus notabilis]|uniref:Uncharacterized protein n=1 Tax=Morus notabilis TaxID=981085 RepID=W9RSC6_9ROSA|nr:hypothetical protein L484_011976 [Morus notabilis]